MKTRYEVWMDGVALSSLHDDLAIIDIEYEAPSLQNTTFKRAQGAGAYVSARYLEKTSVTVTFELHIYDPAERQRACASVARWAQGSILQTSDRHEQRLHCICEECPVITSASKWTEALTMSFSAYALPYWEEQNPVLLTLIGTSGSDTMYVPGTAEEAYAEAEISAVAPITTLTLTAGSSSITLSGLSVPAEGVIKVYHDGDSILHIELGETSILNKRTGDDELAVPCNARSTFGFTADGQVSCKFSVRGLWL